MKALLAILLFFTQSIVFAQLGTNQIEEYKELIFTVRRESDHSIGTAFVVGKSESHFFLATAKHVLNGDKSAILTSLNGTEYKASLVREHDVHDLALLQTPLLPIKTDRGIVIPDIEMNDEVMFLSAKDSGKLLPSKTPGIIRDVTDKSLSLVMDEVGPGHSGSPVFGKNGITGMILKNGRFIECMNISLVKEIIDVWGDESFEGFFVEKKAIQLIGNVPRLDKDKKMVPVSVVGVESASETKNLTNLVDGKLETTWSYSVESGEEMEILISLEEPVALGSVRIYIPYKFSNFFPAGSIHFIDNKRRKEAYTSFSSIFKEKERHNNGYWFVYDLPKPESATTILLQFKNNRSVPVSFCFSEIQFYGVEL